MLASALSKEAPSLAVQGAVTWPRPLSIRSKSRLEVVDHDLRTASASRSLRKTFHKERLGDNLVQPLVRQIDVQVETISMSEATLVSIALDLKGRQQPQTTSSIPIASLQEHLHDCPYTPPQHHFQ